MPHKSKEDRNRQRREWTKKNVPLLRAIGKRYRDLTRLRVLIAYGGNPPKCACCGEWRIEFLTLDHINNDGAKERKERKERGGSYVYTRLSRENFPPGFQILCWNCNVAKGMHKQCPHKSSPDREVVILDIDPVRKGRPKPPHFDTKARAGISTAKKLYWQQWREERGLGRALLSQKERRARARANGLCGNCEKRPRISAWHCEVCRDKQRTRSRLNNHYHPKKTTARKMS